METLIEGGLKARKLVGFFQEIGVDNFYYWDTLLEKSGEGGYSYRDNAKSCMQTVCQQLKARAQGMDFLEKGLVKGAEPFDSGVLATQLEDLSAHDIYRAVEASGGTASTICQCLLIKDGTSYSFKKKESLEPADKKKLEENLVLFQKLLTLKSLQAEQHLLEGDDIDELLSVRPIVGVGSFYMMVLDRVPRDNPRRNRLIDKLNAVLYNDVWISDEEFCSPKSESALREALEEFCYGFDG